MKSQKRMDREIASIADIINTRLEGKSIHTHQADIAFAIYHTLCWARGRREAAPSAKVDILLSCTPKADAEGR